MKKTIANAICNNLKSALIGPDVILVLKRKNPVIIMNGGISVCLEGNRIESGFRFIVYEDPLDSNKVKLFLWGIEYAKRPCQDWGSPYEDDVRRIRFYIENTPSPSRFFEVSQKGEVCTVGSVQIWDYSALQQLYLKARKELESLYLKTQVRLSELRAGKDGFPRDIDYINSDLAFYRADYLLFNKYRALVGNSGLALRASRDGIYPFYSCQTTKILVVGRTPYGLLEFDSNNNPTHAKDYIETTFGHEQKKEGGRTATVIMKEIGQLFHPQLQPEVEYFHLFGRPGGNCFSYAFINACPINYSNVSTATNWSEYRTVMSNTISILKDRIINLNPDVVIALAIEGRENGKREEARYDYIKKYLQGTLNQSVKYENIEVYSIVNGIPLLYLKRHPSRGMSQDVKDELKDAFYKVV